MAGSSYWPDGTLRTLLETIIQNYEEDREKYWSDDEQTARLRSFVDAVATSVVASTDNLVLRVAEELGAIGWQNALDVVETLELSREVREKAEILIAWRFATSTDDMADRCLELVRVVLTAHPSERILRFMRRAARCYVAGFMPEATIACRGVLESAVDEAIRSKGLALGDKMKSKLTGLTEGSVLHRSTADNAWIVWQRGNAAVHKDPDAVGQVLETITFTLSTLEELQAAGGLSGG